MASTSQTKLTLEDFLANPISDGPNELINGKAVPKVSPKRFHAGIQKALLKLIDAWAEGRGHFFPEWAIALQRHGQDWVPIPDLTYVSFERLEPDWLEDAPCPVPADLAIEILFPNQTFGDMAEKATDYLIAGLARVWIVDPKAQSITVFIPDALPITYRGARVFTDSHLPGLEVIPQGIFQRAGLTPDQN